MEDTLKSAIDYEFNNPKLLKNALNHSSLRRTGVEFEKLEFLGDRILGAVIADFLYKHSKFDNEGNMACKFSSLVNAKACYQVALSIKLNEVIQTANNKLLRRNTTVLADGIEALIGAIFVDGGYESAKRVILKIWHDLLLNIDIYEPKTQLQELAQENGGIPPNYLVISKTGPEHAPLFCVEVKTMGISSTGNGFSKKEAEISAAKAALEKLTNNTNDQHCK